jgi:hypothetical protein
MMRQLTWCVCALVALLLLCGDAGAQGCGPVYGGYGYAANYGYYAPSYGYAASYYAPSYGYAASYYAPSYGYAASYGGYGSRYNPGGLGGPYSGLGVRPGLGFGGFGLRR